MVWINVLVLNFWFQESIIKFWQPSREFQKVDLEKNTQNFRNVIFDRVWERSAVFLNKK